MAERGAPGRGAPPGRLRAAWRRRSLQARLTILATLVVAAGLAAGSLLLVGSLQRSLVAAVDGTARQQAQDIAALAVSNRLPDPLPAASGGTVVLQVVDAGGRVVAASVGGDRVVPLLTRAQLILASDRRPRFLDGSRVGQEAPLRVVVWPATYRGAPVRVLAAASFASVASSLHIVELALVVGLPLLLLLLAAVAWVTVGWTLRPVGELRRGAEEITEAGASRQLPLPSAHDEIFRLADTLNRMLDRLQRASSRQRAFVADAAHELRTPLASMRTQLEVSLAHPGSADWPQVVAAALEDNLRLARTVDDLLVLARLDERHVDASAGTVDLGDLVRQVAGRVEGSGLALRVHVAGEVSVAGDAAALDRVVRNLLDNALRHANSRVEVSVEATNGWVVLVVADDGPGIPAADRERVFERFTRLDDARSHDSGGTGLGLAIVREIVRAHRGEVTVEDAAPDGDSATRSEGTRVVTRLPGGSSHRPPAHGGALLTRPRLLVHRSGAGSA